ncbi:hypothetical protein [Streptococcus salivarius]
MIRVVEVSTENGYRKGLATLINETLLELLDRGPIEVIDIKYQAVALDMHGGFVIRSSALIIYKELD